MGLLLLFPAAGGPAAITGTLTETLDGVTVAASGTNGHGGTLSATLASVTVAASGTSGHGATLSATLDGVTVAISGAVDSPEAITGDLAVSLAGVSAALSGTSGHPGTASATLDGVSVALTGANGHPSTVAVTLDDVAVLLDGISGHAATISAALDGIAAEALGSVSVAEAGGALFRGVNFMLEPLKEDKEEEKPAPKRVKAIIARVARAEAEIGKPFKLAPIREAFQAVSYPFKSDYYELYRQAYKAELERLREEEDEDDAVLMLM